MKIFRIVPTLLLVMLLLCFPSHNSHAGLLKKLGVAGAAVGAYTAADLAFQATALVTFSVFMTHGAQQCAKTRCTDQLLVFLKAHPVAGPPLVKLALKRTAKKHPEMAQAVQMVSSELKDKLKASAKSQPTSNAKVDPPGDCSKKQHSELNKKISKYCKSQKRRCDPKDPFDLLSQKLELNWQCAVARYNMMDICFQGGDKGHKDELGRVIDAVARCEKAMLEK